jgi:predicted nucleotidyltransferase
VLCGAGLDWPLWLQEVEASRICGQSAHEVGKVVSSTHLYPQEILRSRVEPKTTVLVAQCLNQMHHRVRVVLGGEQNTQTSDWICLMSCLK